MRHTNTIQNRTAYEEGLNALSDLLELFKEKNIRCSSTYSRYSKGGVYIKISRLLFKIKKIPFYTTDSKVVEKLRGIERIIDNYDLKKFFSLWFMLNAYSIDNNHKVSFDERYFYSPIKQIKDRLMKLCFPDCEKYKNQDKKSEYFKYFSILPAFLSDGILIKMIYESNDKDLINIFEDESNNLPRPRAVLWGNENVPQIVQEREIEASKYLVQCFRQSELTPVKFEEKAMKIQRRWRGRYRKALNKTLWANVQRSIKFNFNCLPFSKNVIEQAQDNGSIGQVYSSYEPNCNDELKSRLLKLADQVRPFNEIIHVMPSKNIPSIFDDGLYAEKSLRQQLKYSGKISGEIDIDDKMRWRGDYNTIFFDVFDSVRNRYDSVELVLDFDKLGDNAGIFIKQDFSTLSERKNREISIGELKFNFDHTYATRHGYFLFKSDFHIFFANGNLPRDDDHIPVFKSSVLINFLISTDFKNMYKFLVMNFFRFIDNLQQTKYAKKWYLSPVRFKSRLYRELGKLNDKELMTVLQDIANKISDSVHVNFQTAYLIEQSAIKEIRYEYEGRKHVLDMSSFIDKLKTDDSFELVTVYRKIPGLFKSYRFIDHLLGQIGEKAPKVKNTLLKLRNVINLPKWRQNIEKWVEPTKQVAKCEGSGYFKTSGKRKATRTEAGQRVHKHSKSAPSFAP